MRNLGLLIVLLAASSLLCLGQEAPPPRPRAGKVEFLKTSQIQPGMKGYAWTVFQGTEPEAVPVEIIGVWTNALGPRQDVILAKLGGQAERTNVAGGMSGSPVYIDGKLAGAISLRVSLFSPDAICGITPIDSMLEVSDIDDSVPQDALTPDKAATASRLTLPDGMLPKAVAQAPVMTPIETPLVFSGFSAGAMREIGPLFQQLGVPVMQGGAGGALGNSRPAPGWEKALQPGDMVAAVLVSGDMTITAQGTVTYNDGRRVLAFGHSLYNLGPIEMPMSKSEVLMTLASSYQPNKFANPTEIVGAMKQDRQSGVSGVLGEQAEMIPVSLTIRTLGEDNKVLRERTYRYNVFAHRSWTPTLMMTTLMNTLSNVNDAGENNTFRLSGKVEMDGQRNLSFATMQAPAESQMPAPAQLAVWVGDRFSRLYSNAVTPPHLKGVEVSVDLLPERRVATIDNAWASLSEADAGQDVPVRVFLRPYRGARLEKQFSVKIPAGLPAGEYRILLSDSDTLNRMQTAAGRANRFIDLGETISLINQERPNNQLYVSLVSSATTVYSDDKTLPSLPASVLNVLESGRTSGRPFVTARETAAEQAAIPFDYVVSGSYSLTIRVK
jgi:hypothetical protein